MAAVVATEEVPIKTKPQHRPEDDGGTATEAGTATAVADLAPNPDDAPPTTRLEMAAYYLYYVGANGLALFNFAPAVFQSLLERAAADDSEGAPGLLDFLGRPRDVNSIVLLANGISFAIQAVLMLGIGAYADFGTGRRWVLLLWSLVAYGVGLAWLAVHEPGRWHVAAALYIVGLVAYQLTLTYWTAAFPARRAHAAGELDGRQLARRDELERSRLSNVAFGLQSMGEVVMVAALVGLMFVLRISQGPARNSWGLSVLIAAASAAWLALSLPWFVLERRRPGMRVPAGRSVVAARHVAQLRQSLIYLAGYFLLGDSLNTSVTVITTLQNQVVGYSTLTLAYLLMVGIAGFWQVQQRLRLSAKTMLVAVTVAIVLLDGWGMAGNWTDRLGFRHVWEIWLYQALYGLLVCPWYSYSQIMISSVTPRGHEFLFFSIFNVVGKTSSFIGPFVSSAIIDSSPGSRNDRAPFYFLFALSLASAAGLWIFLDLDVSAREQEVFLARRTS